MYTTSADGQLCSSACSDSDRGSVASKTRTIRSAASELFLGPLDAGPFDWMLATPQPGGVGQFDRPAVQRGRGGEHVAGGAGRVVNDRPGVAEHRVDQTALADVRPAR